jgi:hypothetical protein
MAISEKKNLKIPHNVMTKDHFASQKSLCNCCNPLVFFLLLRCQKTFAKGKKKRKKSLLRLGYHMCIPIYNTSWVGGELGLAHHLLTTMLMLACGMDNSSMVPHVLEASSQATINQ